MNENGPGATIVARRTIIDAAPRYSSLFIVSDSGEIHERSVCRLKESKVTANLETEEVMLQREEQEEEESGDEEIELQQPLQIADVNICQ